MATDNGTDRATLERVQKLVRLAASGDTEEARTAAMQATRLMKEHELVLVPRSEIERIERMVSGAQQLAESQKSEKMQNMAIGALAGFLFASKGKGF